MSGEDLAGFVDFAVAVEESLAVRESAGRPLFLGPTVTFVALANWPPPCEAGELDPDPGTWTLSPPGLEDGGVSMDEDEAAEDFTETMRGRALMTCVAGIGSLVASSRYTSDMTDDRARDGVME
jgi:hypothetical protein